MDTPRTDAPTHIDDWLDSPRCKDNEAYAKFVFEYFRRPAWQKSEFWPWMKNHPLFCTWRDKRYRVTGASRMGDIWLAKDFTRDIGYDHRVNVDECHQWGDKP